MSEHECKYEGELPAFMATVTTHIENIDKRIGEYIIRADKTNDDQFTKINRNTENIAGMKSTIDSLGKCMKDGGVPAYIKIPWRKIVLVLGLAGSGGAAILTWASDAILYVRDNALDIFLK